MVSVLRALSTALPCRPMVTVGAVVSMRKVLSPSLMAEVSKMASFPVLSFKSTSPAWSALATAVMPPVASVSPACTVYTSTSVLVEVPAWIRPLAAAL